MAARLTAKTDGKAATSWDKDIAPETFPRLNVLGEPPDPLEDYTTYTEVDPDNAITVAANQIDVTSATVLNHAYHVYKDKGVDFFNGNFTHLAKARTDRTQDAPAHYAFPASWMIANDVGAWYYSLTVGGKSFLFFSLAIRAGVTEADLYESDSGTLYYDYDTGYTLASWYWTKMVRDEAVGTYGTMYSYVYSDSTRTTLVSSQALTLHTSKKDYRYIYGLNLDASGGTTVAYCADLDLAGAPAQSVVPMLFNQLSMQGGD